MFNFYTKNYKCIIFIYIYNIIYNKSAQTVSPYINVTSAAVYVCKIEQA